LNKIVPGNGFVKRFYQKYGYAKKLPRRGGFAKRLKDWMVSPVLLEIIHFAVIGQK
jgi:hypothetical protein